MMVTPWDFDRELLLALNFDGGSTLDFVMYYVSQTWFWIPLYGLMLWVIYRRVGLKNLLWFVLFAGLMILCADQTSGFFKTNLPKFRPTHYDLIGGIVHTVYDYQGGNFGTVSAHAANCMAFLILAGGVISRRWAWIVLGIWVAMVCYSRIYLGVHYPMDVFFGLLTGMAYGFLWSWVYRKVEKRKR